MLRLAAAFAALALSAMPALAQSWQYWSSNPETPPDVPGAADPDGMQRVANSTIIGFDQTGFDAHDALLAPAGDGKMKAAEGPRTQLLYVMPGDQSPLEVIGNYQAALEGQGFTTLFDCRGDACGGKSTIKDALYPTGAELENYGEMGTYAMVDLRNDVAYIALENAETGQTVTVFAAFNTWDLIPQIHEKTVALVNVIGEGFTQRMETVTREAIATGLEAEGRITLDGIFFDVDSDAITAASAPALAEIAAFLENAPDLNAYIVGHTDSTGAYHYNVELSLRRATAVMRALVVDHNISEKRLVPAGVGPLAPVGLNETEEGRALNRRVELVKR
ncbi:MAG: OmpA family protein [Pseudomonadota bacterium]